MKIFQLEIWKYSFDGLLTEVTQFLDENIASQNRWKAIFTPNPEMCLKTLKDREFLEVLQKADYLTSDGIGLYLGYQMNSFPKLISLFLLPYFLFNIILRKKYLYKKHGERICGSDLTTALVEFSQENNIHIAILDPYSHGDIQKKDAQKNFSENLKKVFPQLLFDHYIYSEENSQEIFQKIQKSQAKILFSTLGMKKQEISVLEWLKRCPKLRLWLAVGSSFDYYTGFQKRAPKVWRTLGFEWLYRIFTSPRKLQRLSRIFQALIVFPLKVLIYRKGS